MQVSRQIGLALAGVLLLSACTATSADVAPSAETPSSALEASGVVDAGAPALPRTVTRDAMSADCVDASTGAHEGGDHIDVAGAPPLSTLYPQVPPDGGPHFAEWEEVDVDARSRALDVRAVVHNQEHGALGVWVSPELLDDETLDAIEAWANQLNGLGFENGRIGGGVFVMAMPTDATTTAPIAFRGWGVGMDCTAWDLSSADAFIANHYGSRGSAPEGQFSPYPDVADSLREAAGA